MGHFANPLQVTAVPSSRSIRVSVRASDTRIDEWTISAADVDSVLSWDNGTGWRGNGELRVLLDRTGGSVAFHSTTGDRAIIRGPESMVYSFLAHLQAAFDELPSVLPEPQPKAAVQVVYTPVPAAPQASPVSQEILSAIQQQVAQGHAELLTSIQQLASVVRTALATSPAPAPVLQSSSVPTTSDPVFIPSVSTAVEGTGLTADSKTSDAGDLAAAAAALKAAKKNTTPETTA